MRDRQNVSNRAANQSDEDPYYDEVPFEETDDEIEADISCGGKRNAATPSLVRLFNQQIGCEKRSSNYTNIDYFLS